jgi:hypothetical protein
MPQVGEEIGQTKAYEPVVVDHQHADEPVAHV